MRTTVDGLKDNPVTRRYLLLPLAPLEYAMKEILSDESNFTPLAHFFPVLILGTTAKISDHVALGGRLIPPSESTAFTASANSALRSLSFRSASLTISIKACLSAPDIPLFRKIKKAASATTSTKPFSRWVIGFPSISTRVFSDVPPSVE